MAGFTIETRLRPCIVWDTYKGLFHCWGHEGYICETGQVYRTYAIIELEDGTVEEVAPEDFRFVPGNIFKQYDFREFDKEDSDDQTRS